MSSGYPNGGERVCGLNLLRELENHGAASCCPVDSNMGQIKNLFSCIVPSSLNPYHGLYVVTCHNCSWCIQSIHQEAESLESNKNVSKRFEAVYQTRMIFSAYELRNLLRF